MLVFKKNLPVKVLPVNKVNENCYVEVISKKTKWLINHSFSPTKNNMSSHLESLSRNLNLCTSKFEIIVVISDLNIPVEDNNLKHCESYNLKSLIKILTCYQNPKKLSSIDFILTNKPKNFQKSCIIEISLSDSRKMTVTTLRMQFCKRKPRVLFCRYYTKFQIKLLRTLSKLNWVPNSFFLMKIDFWIFAKFAQRHYINLCHLNGRQQGKIKVRLSIRKFQKLL